METLTLTIKDPAKKDFILELLANLSFVEVQTQVESDLSEEAKDRLFFEGQGMWAGRDIDADQLRKDAWTRNG